MDSMHPILVKIYQKALADLKLDKVSNRDDYKKVWDYMYNFLESKKDIPNEYQEKQLDPSNYITAVSDDYPERFKASYFPPFAYIKGEEAILDRLLDIKKQDCYPFAKMSTDKFIEADYSPKEIIIVYGFQKSPLADLIDPLVESVLSKEEKIRFFSSKFNKNDLVYRSNLITTITPEELFERIKNKCKGSSISGCAKIMSIDLSTDNSSDYLFNDGKLIKITSKLSPSDLNKVKRDLSCINKVSKIEISKIRH